MWSPSYFGVSLFLFTQAKKFISELTKIAERDYNSLFSVDQMRQIASVSCASQLPLNIISIYFNCAIGFY